MHTHMLKSLLAPHAPTAGGPPHRRSCPRRASAHPVSGARRARLQCHADPGRPRSPCLGDHAAPKHCVSDALRTSASKAGAGCVQCVGRCDTTRHRLAVARARPMHASPANHAGRRLTSLPARGRKDYDARRIAWECRAPAWRWADAPTAREARCCAPWCEACTATGAARSVRT